MPRPPYFGERTPKVVALLQQLSENHKVNSTQLSLLTLAQRVRAAVPGIKPAPKPFRDKTTGKMVRPPDPLRHIIFKLAKKHSIWFGKPS